MSKVVGKLIGLVVAAAGIYVVGKYLHDYTDYKAAGDDDLDGIRSGGSDMKKAVKRTYVAIKEKGDVRSSADEIGNAFGEMAQGTGKLIETVGNNTAAFVKNEKAKYDQDPKAYREEVAGNFRDMGHQAVNTFNTIKDDAIDVAYDIKNAAVKIKDDAKDIIEPQTPENVSASDSADSGIIIREDTEKLN